MARQMTDLTVLARKRPCPTCGAQVGKACERKRDGYGHRYRANYTHKTRLPGYRWKHCGTCRCADEPDPLAAVLFPIEVKP